MTRHRLRIRFSKEGNLRLIGHRDLVRTFERLFRRANVPLAMTQGFHPRPQMTFPDALALGVAGRQEVTDIGVTEAVSVEDLHQRLSEQAPDGLAILSVEALPAEARKAKLARVSYELPLPGDVDLDALRDRLVALRRDKTITVRRNEKQVSVDLAETLENLDLRNGCLEIGIRTSAHHSLQPRDILACLGLGEVLREGSILTRTQVELTHENPKS